MQKFKDYVDVARNRHNLKSNNEVARQIGIKGPSLVVLYNGKNLPSEGTMIKIASLAGIEPEKALIDLSLWRSAKNPALKSLWERIGNAAQKAALYTLLATIMLPYFEFKNNEVKDLQNQNATYPRAILYIM